MTLRTILKGGGELSSCYGCNEAEGGEGKDGKVNGAVCNINGAELRSDGKCMFKAGNSEQVAQLASSLRERGG